MVGMGLGQKNKLFVLFYDLGTPKIILEKNTQGIHVAVTAYTLQTDSPWLRGRRLRASMEDRAQEIHSRNCSQSHFPLHYLHISR
jgi:hypothetical protein